VLQLEPVAWRTTLAGCRVIVYEHLDDSLSMDDSLSIGYGPHEVGRFQTVNVSGADKAKTAPTRKTFRT